MSLAELLLSNLLAEDDVVAAASLAIQVEVAVVAAAATAGEMDPPSWESPPSPLPWAAAAVATVTAQAAATATAAKFARGWRPLYSDVPSVHGVHRTQAHCGQTASTALGAANG